MRRPMNVTKLIAVLVLATSLSVSVLAQGLPKVEPDQVGFSAQRLKRLSTVFQSDVDKGAIPGAVVLIARDGKVVFFEAFGFQDREKRIPMKPDSICGIRAFANFASYAEWCRICRATWDSIPAAWWCARASWIPSCPWNRPPCPVALSCSGIRKTARIWASSKWTSSVSE